MQPTLHAGEAAGTEPTLPIPGYRIIDVLGRGGMAVVYLAIQESVGREVALKVLATEFAADTAFSERFLREARIVSRLSHPNIITVYDAGVHERHHYISMEFVPGESLKEAGPRLSLRERLRVVCEVARALEFAGRKGVVHRDVKPDNILLHEDGRVILTDFGIAHGGDLGGQTTVTRQAMGTPYYMSPEQHTGQKVDHRSDIYNLGVVFYQLLTGQVPYEGDSLVAVGIRHVSDPIPLLPSALQLFQPIINTCMSKSPEHRYQSAGELAAAIEALPDFQLDMIEASGVLDAAAATDYAATTLAEPVDGAAPPAAPRPQARSTPRPGPVVRPPERRRRPWLLLLVLAAAATAAWFGRDQLRAPAPPSGQTAPAPVANLPPPEEPAAAPAPATGSPGNAPGGTPAGVKLPPVEKLVALRGELDAKPENAELLARLYRFRLRHVPDDDVGREGLEELQRWFWQHMEQAWADGDLAAARRHLVHLAQVFPDAAETPEYTDMQARIERAEEVAAQLEAGEARFARGELVSPEGLSAADAWRAVLALEPDNAAAREGLARIAATLLEQARQARDAGEPERALTRVEEGLAVAPDQPELVALRETLERERARRRHINALLLQAQRRFDAGRLLRPEGDSAYDVLRRVLAEDPGNVLAERGLRRIANALAQRASDLIINRRWARAERVLDEAQHRFPGDPHLAELRRTLEHSLPGDRPRVFDLEALPGNGLEVKVQFRYRNFPGPAVRLVARLHEAGSRRLIKEAQLAVTGREGEYSLVMRVPRAGAAYFIDLRRGQRALGRTMVRVPPAAGP